MTLSMLPCLSMAGEDIRWHQEGMALTKNLKELLIAAGRCASKDDCTKQHLVFFRPISDGLEISLYGVSNTDSDLVSKSLAQCAYSLAANGMTTISLTVFTFSKEAEMKRANLFGEKSSQTYTIKGKYANRPDSK